MDRRHRSFVTGVHRLQHVEGLLASTFTYDDTVRSHAQRVLHEFTLPDLALSLGVWWARLQPAYIWKLELQFSRILDRDNSFLRRDIGRQSIEQRGFATTGTP